MILANLKLDEESELEFSMDIFGTSSAASDTRLVIEGKDFDIVCHGTYANGNLKVKIPKLKGIIESGQHECKIECLIDGKIFSPLNESIEFEPLVEFDVKKTKAAIMKEEVKVSPVKVTTRTTEKNKIEEAFAAGYTIAEYAGYNVLKKNDKYLGFVTESKMVLAEDTYDSIAELVDALGSK